MPAARCVDQRGCAVRHSEGAWAAGSGGEAGNGVDVRALACHVVSFLVAGARGGYVSPSQLNASVFVENIRDTEPRSLLAAWTWGDPRCAVAVRKPVRVPSATSAAAGCSAARQDALIQSIRLRRALPPTRFTNTAPSPCSHPSPATRSTPCQSTQTCYVRCRGRSRLRRPARVQPTVQRRVQRARAVRVVPSAPDHRLDRRSWRSLSDNRRGVRRRRVARTRLIRSRFAQHDAERHSAPGQRHAVRHNVSDPLMRTVGDTDHV